MSILADAIALSLTPFSWRRTIGERLKRGVPPDELLRAVAPPDVDPGQLRVRLAGEAHSVMTRARARGIAAVSWLDAAYPPALAAIPDPPPVLWVLGDPAVLSRPAVALVGSRAGTPYALAVAEQLAGDLAARGVLVVSGLARGVDSAAHRGALAARGATVAVLGSGVDIVYPREHRAMADAMIVQGAVVSELAPGTRPLQWFFPLRNRIISGLVRAVVIVEAGERSGSLITARCALEQGREVLAVPGNVLGGRNRGGHALLPDGAKIVETADDILEELDLPVGGPASQEQTSRLDRRPGDPVLASLAPGEPADIEGIVARTGMAVGRVLARLCELELGGLVRRTGGGRFVRP
ncbi:MAG: DNA-processing protein DprA [Vicinamibacterales bacterium]